MIKVMFKSTYNEFMDDYENLLNENGDLEKQIKGKENVIQKKNMEILEKEQKYKDLQILQDISIKKLEKKISEQIQLLEQKTTSYEEKLNDKSKTIKSYQDRIKILEQESKELKLEIKKITNVLGETVIERDNLKSHLSDTEAKIEIQKKKIQDLTKQQPHTIEEYQNDGLHKSLKNRNKGKRKSK